MSPNKEKIGEQNHIKQYNTKHMGIGKLIEMFSKNQ